MVKMCGAILADLLEEAGIDHIFGIPGGAMPLLLDAFADRKETFKTIVARQEGGAACMADMYGRLTGKPGVLVGQGLWIGTSGGYGIVESYMSGVPMLILTEISDYGGLPQFSPYQDASGDYGAVDLPNIMKSMTKYTTVATNASQFIHGVKLAIKHAVTGRPGPACVIFNFEVSAASIDPEAANPRLYPLSGHLRTSPPCISKTDAKKAAEIFIAARNPVLIAGRGVHDARAYDEVREIAELLGMPVATSYMGKSAIPETHPLAVGTMGAIGQKLANDKIAGADVILTVGTCLSPDNTKFLSPDFIKPDVQKIIQIDIEERNTGWTYPIELGITSDARLALSMIIDTVKESSIDVDVDKRIATLLNDKAEYGLFNDEVLFSNETPIRPERVVRELNEAVSADDLIVLDGGNNRMWMSHHFQSKGVGQIIAGGGAAAVGYGPPASIAAQILQPGRRVVCVSGDGGLMMHLYTLEMAKQYELPIIFVVMNNSCLGNVMDYQAPDRRIMTQYPQPNFASIAEGIGCEGIRVEAPVDIKSALKRAFESKRPTVVDIVVQDIPHFSLMS